MLPQLLKYLKLGQYFLLAYNYLVKSFFNSIKCFNDLSGFTSQIILHLLHLHNKMIYNTFGVLKITHRYESLKFTIPMVSAVLEFFWATLLSSRLTLDCSMYSQMNVTNICFFGCFIQTFFSINVSYGSVTGVKTKMLVSF